MKNVIYLLLVLLAVSSNCHAAHLGNVTIKRIRLFNDSVLVETNEQIVKADCATVDRYFMVPLDESYASNRRFSVLLAAQSQNKIFNPNCTSTCSSKWASWLGDVTLCTEASIQ